MGLLLTHKEQEKRMRKGMLAAQLLESVEVDLARDARVLGSGVGSFRGEQRGGSGVCPEAGTAVPGSRVRSRGTCSQYAYEFPLHFTNQLIFPHLL